MSTVSLNAASRISAQIILPGLLLLIICYLAVQQLSAPLTIIWDDALYLQFAQLMLQGQKPYVDFTDINPPMIIYLSLLPVGLSHCTNLHVIVAFKCLVIGLAALCTFMSFFIMRSHITAGGKWQCRAFLLISIATFNNLLGREFGQREHLFILCYLPFFFIRFARIEEQEQKTGWPLATICGVMAAIGLCLKPYFLLVLLSTEVYWLVFRQSARRLVRVETVALTVIGLTYALHIFIMPEAMRSNLFGEASNVWLFQKIYGYGMIQAAVLGGPFFPFSLVTVFLVVLTALFLQAKKGILTLDYDNYLVGSLVAFLIGAYLCCVVQQKFWTYYKIPLLTAVLMLASVELAILSKILLAFTQKKKRAWQIFARALEPQVPALLVATCVATYIILCCYLFANANLISRAFQIESPNPERKPSSALQAEWQRLAQTDAALNKMLKYSQCGDRILVLNTILFPAYPAFVQLGRLPSSRYPYEFSLLEFAAGQDFANQIKSQTMATEYREKQTAVLQQILTEKNRNKPRLIMLRKLNKNETQTPDTRYLRQALTEDWFSSELQKGYFKGETFVDTKDEHESYFTIWQRHD